MASITQSLTSKTETTATIKWVSDSIIDYLWFSTDEGLTWNELKIADSTKGTYIINGLESNTTYKVKTRVRIKKTKQPKESATMSVTTYPYPYATSMPSFIIGEKVTINLYNPLKRSVTVTMIGADNSQIIDLTTSSTSVTGYNSSTAVDRLYASIPYSKSGMYKIRVAYETHIETRNGGLYKVNENNCKPNILSVTYEDTEQSIIAITGNNKDIVRNKSIVRYDVDGLAGAKGATITACTISVNGYSYDLTISGTTATGGMAVIDSATDVYALATVTDSRGITSSLRVLVHMLDWYIPSAIINANREHNYYSDTDITVYSDYASLDGENQITISYEATKDGEQSPSITGYLQDETTETLTLDNNYSWTLDITLVDRLNGSATYSILIPEGMPIIFFDRNKKSVGINCFPTMAKSLEIGDENVIINGKKLVFNADNTVTWI